MTFVRRTLPGVLFALAVSCYGGLASAEAPPR